MCMRKSALLLRVYAGVHCWGLCTRCDFLTQFITIPAKIIAPFHFPELAKCDDLNTCSSWTYQSQAPTMTSDRFCNNGVTNCTANHTYSPVSATITTDVVCNMTISNCYVPGSNYISQVCIQRSPHCESVVR